MDVASLAGAFVSFQSAQQQSMLALAMMKSNAQASAALADMIDAAAQGASRLANLGPGIGGSLDISA
ncbi:MAG TPA: hypothetical protein VG985_01600 [Xanthobacteraceae bacterium]|nr:hypothetical protein [Xanthobacteraceae bacterium]